MIVLQSTFVVVNLVAFAVFVLTLSAVSVRVAAGEGPSMRRSSRFWNRRIAR